MVKPCEPGDGAEHDDDEDDAGQVERDHQLGERDQRRDAVFADGEGHRAEGADRRRLHDDPDQPKSAWQRLSRTSSTRLAALAERLQREAEQHREEQHLQDVALREGADDGVGDDVQQELDRALLLGLRDEALDRPWCRAALASMFMPAPGCSDVADDRGRRSAPAW